MKINKDNIIGAIVMLLILTVVAWGVTTTVQLQKVSRAHDNLVGLLDPVIQQLVQSKQIQAQQRRMTQPPAGSAVPAQKAVPAPEAEVKK